MEDVKIILSGLWVATMLCYLLGDVIRVFSGGTEPGKIAGKPPILLTVFFGTPYPVALINYI